MAPQLSKKQLQDQNAILESLGNVGWDKTDKSKLVKLAELSYRNDTMTLEVEHNWRKNVIFLRLFSDEGDIFFMIEYKDTLTAILNTLIKFQKDISPDNFKDFVRALVKVCPNVFLDAGDKVIPLIDDENINENIALI